METYIIGITGASGSAYALRISDALLESGAALRVVATDTGRRVLEYETGVSLERWAGERPNAVLEDNADLFSPLASGSRRFAGMVVAPCSMSTLAGSRAASRPTCSPGRRTSCSSSGGPSCWCRAKRRSPRSTCRTC